MYSCRCKKTVATFVQREKKEIMQSASDTNIDGYNAQSASHENNGFSPLRTEYTKVVIDWLSDLLIISWPLFLRYPMIPIVAPFTVVVFGAEPPQSLNWPFHHSDCSACSRSKKLPLQGKIRSVPYGG